MIKFNQKTWVKPYIDINTKLRKKVKNNFEKQFFKLVNNSVFGKTMESVRKKLEILKITNRRNYLVSDANYHAKTFFTENLLAIEIRKTQIPMKNPGHIKLYCMNIEMNM